MGDVNADGDVDIGDVLEILKHLAGLTDNAIDQGVTGALEAALITPESKADQKVSIGDALEILKFLAGLENLLA